MLMPGRIATLALLALAAPLAPPEQAAAQVSDGCFVRGQQVADSVCNPASGGGGGPSMNSAAMDAAGSLGFAIGGALGSMLRDAMTAPPPDNGSDEDAAAAAANQAAALQNAHANFTRQQQQRQAAQQQQQQQFKINQQDLLGQVRSLDGDQSGGDDSPVVDLDGNGGKAASLQPRQLDMSGDSGAVDLTGAGTTTLDPRRVKGQNGKPASKSGGKSALQPAKDEDMQYLLPPPTALQLADDADMQYLFPDQPSLWPGPKNPDARLLNPLRQRAEYLKFLSAEETQFPGKRAEIEKLRKSLDSDAERRKALANEGAKIARDYNATVAAADADFSAKLTKVLDADDRTYGAASHQALFDKSHQDAALADTLRQQTRPLLDARAQTVDHAQANAMLSMFDAFDRINPGLPR